VRPRLQLGGSVRPLNFTVRSRLKKALYVAVAVLALIGALTLLTPLLVPLSKGCYTQRLSAVTSPSGRAVGTLELAQCKGDQPAGILVWVAFPPDRTQHLVMQAPPQSTDVRLTWQNDRSLIVTYPETVHPETKWSRSVPGVTVEFHPFSVYSQN